MVVKMSSPGRSFGGVADYCLHDPRMPGLEASGGQKAGAPWAGTQRTGAGLWPQPLGRSARRGVLGSG